MADSKTQVFGLPGFETLGKGTYLYIPDSATGTSSSSVVKHPDLIFVLGWMNGSLRNVAKYLDTYKLLYPTSSLLVITSSSSDFFFNTEAKQALRFAPAIAAIRATVGAKGHSGPDRAQILVHAFSNGGAGQLAMLSAQYLKVAESTLPASAIIFDSAPGKSRFAQGLKAFSIGLPSNPVVYYPMLLVIALLLLVAYTIPEALGWTSAAEKMRETLNSTEPAYLPKAARRTYVFSDSDEQILEGDLVEHADEATGKGFVVEKERFVGSKHVDHMRSDPERYWAIVKKAWDQRVEQ